MVDGAPRFEAEFRVVLLDHSDRPDPWWRRTHAQYRDVGREHLNLT